MRLLVICWLLILIFFGWIGSSQAAECSQNVQKIQTGTAAPCNGWIVSEPKMQDFAKTDDKLKIEQQITEANKQLLKLSVDEIEFYKDRSKSMTKEVEKAEQRRFWSNMGFFGLGVVLTGIAAKAAIEVAK